MTCPDTLAFPTPTPQGLGWSAQLRSQLHSWRIGWDDRRYRPKAYREEAAGTLLGLAQATERRIQQLRAQFHVAFEQQLSRLNALENYVYLDLLTQLFRCERGTPYPAFHQPSLLDIGSKNFYYARALAAAFAPRSITGVELEGYRRYPDGHCRHDYANHYLAELPDARYHVGDMRDWHTPAEVVTCWYPFVHPATVLKWGLPLSQFDPAAFFRQLAQLVAPGGHLLVVNQGIDEWQLARQWLEPQGLTLERQLVVDAPLLQRPARPVLSWWRAA